MEVRPGYKLTEIGGIPEDWEVSTVGREFDIKLGKMLDAEKNIGIPKPYLGNRAIQWDRIDTSDLPTVKLSRSDIERFRLRKGDLLVCEGGEVGRAAIWDSQLEECYFQKALHRLRPIRGFDVKVMAAMLRLWADCGVLSNYVTQTSIAHLPREKFVDIPLVVPPPAEQRAIASALSDVDALLGALDRLIAKKRDLKQAAMQQLLTGQTRLPGFKGEWGESTVGNEFEIKLGKMLDAEKNVGVPKPFIGNRSVQWDRIDTSDLATVPMTRADMDRFRLQKGDLLVCEGGEVGRAAIWDAPIEECYYQKALHRLRPIRGFNTRFMAALLRLWAECGKYANYVTQTSIAHLPREKFIEMPLPVPSAAEQTAIAEVLSDMDAEIAALEQRREKTRALKQGMMQELLTGRTRLI